VLEVEALALAGVEVILDPEVLSASLPVQSGTAVPEPSVVQTEAVAQYDEDALA
jgi:hypothetical protein